MQNYINDIASEAKQSILSLRGAMDCFVASLLAMTVATPHTQPSSPAKAGDPLFRGANDGIDKPQRTGCPAFAGLDGLLMDSVAG
jgi:hypothetical protein